MTAFGAKPFKFHRPQREIDTLGTRNLPRPIDLVRLSTPRRTRTPACLARICEPRRACHRDCRTSLAWRASQLSCVLFFAAQIGTGGDSGRRTRWPQRAHWPMAMGWPARRRALRGLFSTSGGDQHMCAILLFSAHLVVCLVSAGDAAAAHPDARER